MSKRTNVLVRIALVSAVFLVVGIAVPALANADATCGGTGGGLSQGTNAFPGLTITKLSDVVSTGAETSIISITNTSNATDTLVVKNYQSRCLEHLGNPFRSGLGECQYYWQPTQSQPQQTTEQNLQTITLAPGQSQNVTNIVNQYQNEDCGSMQLDTFLVSVNGVAVSNGQVYGSFADLCNDCTYTAPAQNVAVSCSASPSSIQSGQSTNFNATPTGGNGIYAYVWSGACNGFAESCSNVFNQGGTQTAYLTVTSNGQTATTNCSVSVAQPVQNNLAVTCNSSPSSIQTNQSAIFTATPTGGSGNYTYAWSGACTGSSSTCSNVFNESGNQAASVTVASGGQTATTTCNLSVTQVAQNNLTASCSASPASASTNASVAFNATASGGSGNYTYSWSGNCSGNSSSCSNSFPQPGTYNSSVTVTSGSQTTSASCSVGVTSNTTANVTCSNNSQCGSNGPTGSPTCEGNAIYQSYQTWTCNNAGTSSSYCSNSITQQEQSVCIYNQTCESGSCTTAYVPPYTPPYVPPYTPPYTPTCSYDASERCEGNSVYWFDSCGNQESVAQVCGYNQTCENNTCITQIQNNNNNTSLTVTKQVRDLSSGNLGWSSSVYASPGDVVQFEVIVTTPNNNQYQYGYTQGIGNVEVRDIFPANLIYNNSLTLNGIPNSGNIIGGLNIGSITPGQTTTITYQAQVGPASEFSFGSSTLTNSVSVTSDTGGSANASASVIVSRSNSLSVATTVSTGLTNNPFLDSFFIPLVLAILGIWAYNSGLFGASGWFDAKKSKRKDYLATKELHNKIAKIKEKELAK